MPQYLLNKYAIFIVHAFPNPKSCQFNLLTSGLLEPSDFSVIPRNRLAPCVWSRTQRKMNKTISYGDLDTKGKPLGQLPFGVNMSHCLYC